MQKRWWLFHATNFQTPMHLCFTVCRIIGMFPYKINASTLEISKPCYILSTVVVCIYCVFYLIHIHDIINSEMITYEDVTKIFNSVCYHTLNGLIVIVTHILSNPRMRLLQTILEIYSKLPSKSHQMLSRLIHTKDILILILTILQVLLTFSVRDIKINWDVIVVLFEIYLDMLLLQMNMLYMNCICVLKTSFKKINDDLMNMQSDMTNDMELSVPNLVCHIRKNQLFLIEVKSLMKQHLIISETVRELNLIFTMQLIATISITIYAVVFGLFGLVYWQDGIRIYFVNYFFLFILFVYIMCYISQITLIAWACEACKNQAHEVGTTVCNVHNIIQDDEIKSEVRLLILIFFCIYFIWDMTLQLQHFSLQILHHKNIFSLKGLPADATIFTSIVGRITTYLFLLVQFMIMAHSCDYTSVTNT